MGGRALRGQPGVRLPAAEYHKLKVEIVELLQSKFPWFKICVVEAYNEKESFGDMDILIEAENYQLQDILNVLPHIEYVPNKQVTSVGYRLPSWQPFQIDLIHVPNIAWSSVYFAYNDLGNLMGRIAHKMGFKYGHDGLLYVIRDPKCAEHVIKEVRVTYDLEKAFRLIGYSYQKYLKANFQTLEDIFQYTVENQWFHPDIYLLENRNNIARVRDRKRPTYMAFLKWCESRPFVNTFEWNDELKAEWRHAKLEEAFVEFPDFAAVYKHEMGKFQISQQAKEFFNGSLVIEITGQKGKDVAQIMRNFKGEWDLNRDGDASHFFSWCVAAGREEVRRVFVLWWKEHQKYYQVVV